jgi:hypothetical protein
MKAMRTTDYRRENRVGNYPELQVGFPERNDASDPNAEMERVHVDLNTLDLSRKTSLEVLREVTGNNHSLK